MYRWVKCRFLNIALAYSILFPYNNAVEWQWSTAACLAASTSLVSIARTLDVFKRDWLPNTNFGMELASSFGMGMMLAAHFPMQKENSQPSWLWNCHDYLGRTWQAYLLCLHHIPITLSAIHLLLWKNDYSSGQENRRLGKKYFQYVKWHPKSWIMTNCPKMFIETPASFHV